MVYWMFLLGALVGVVATVSLWAWRYSGLLRFHYDEEGTPYLFLELNDEPHKIVRKKYVMFLVKEDSRQ